MPFTHNIIDIGWWIIPLIALVFIATVNSVNLIDGLDGLAGGVSFVYVLAFSSLLIFYSQFIAGKILIEYTNLSMLCFCISGSLLAYLMLNCFPAKIFMGDTGSLALGGIVASLAVLSRLTLYIPILGIMYVITSMSDIIQVAHYKRTRKRVFLMAPLHHHLELKGIHENKIVMIYVIITMIVSLVSLLLLLCFGG